MSKPKRLARITILILAMLGLLSVSILLTPPSSRAAKVPSNIIPTRTTGTVSARAMANGRIAFDSIVGGRIQIFTMNFDGTDRKQLTFQSLVASNAAWSPDGARIAYVENITSSHSEIFSMNADGSNQTKLTDVGYAYSPAWSPDGTRIAFGALFGRSTQNLYIMNADGTDQRLITQLSRYLGSWTIAWSPDGSKLAVGGPFGPIWLMNADGTNKTQLTHPNPNDAYDADPDWSPDGSRIAFTRWTDCDFNDCYTTHVWITNLDGSDTRMLTKPDMIGGHPAWSPDGQKIIFDSLGELWTINPAGGGLTNITNTSNSSEGSPAWQPLPLSPNVIDDAQFFVRQHYLDFLSREPDVSGLNFWTGDILLCGADPACVESKRINTSAAFFLSIEFQETGYLVYRSYKSSYGNLPNAPTPIKLNEFLPDTQRIGQGVVVGQTGWEQVLENNKNAFFAAFVQRARFVSAFPTSLAPDQFVDQLFANAAVTPAANKRQTAINEFSSAANTADTAARARALRSVAENPTLGQQEFNRAFVLMQYFGYLRRNPNDLPDTNFDGYNFWLNKLNSFNGDYVQSEMVKAFIVSSEYRQRFAP